MDSRAFCKKITDLLIDIKAFDIAIYDLREISAEMDYVIVSSGNSLMHIKGISRNVAAKLKEEKIMPFGSIEHGDSLWVLLDYNEIILHIMTDETREYYNLDEFYHKDLKANKIVL